MIDRSELNVGQRVWRVHHDSGWFCLSGPLVVVRFADNGLYTVESRDGEYGLLWIKGQELWPDTDEGLAAAVRWMQQQVAEEDEADRMTEQEGGG